MNRSVLHIGYHKTATTWFQRHYYPQVQNFRYLPRALVTETLLADSALRFDAEVARRRLGVGASQQPLIVSDEELVGNFQTGGLHGCLSADVARRLRATFGEAAVVVFIRSQPAMIASTYLQYVREGGTHSIDRFLFPSRYRIGQYRQAYRLPLWSFDHLDYGLLLEHYAGLFGRENVHVFLYEAFRADPAAFLESFGRRLGFALAATPPTAQTENASYGRRTLRVARFFLNRFDYRRALDKTTWLHLGVHKLRRGLLDRLNRSPLAGPPVTAATLFRPTTARAIERRYATANRRLAEGWHLPLADHGYPLHASSDEGADEAIENRWSPTALRARLLRPRSSPGPF